MGLASPVSPGSWLHPLSDSLLSPRSSLSLPRNPSGLRSYTRHLASRQTCLLRQPGTHRTWYMSQLPPPASTAALCPLHHLSPCPSPTSPAPPPGQAHPHVLASFIALRHLPTVLGPSYSLPQHPGLPSLHPGQAGPRSKHRCVGEKLSLVPDLWVGCCGLAGLLRMAHKGEVRELWEESCSWRRETEVQCHLGDPLKGGTVQNGPLCPVQARFG